jgi:two-component system, NtrC family, sensor kinase
MGKMTTIDFESVLDAMPFGIFILNRNLEIQWVNRSALRHSTEKDHSRLKGRHCYVQNLRQDRPCDNCPAQTTFETGRVTHRELTIELDGVDRCFQVIAAPLERKGTKGASLVIEMVRDITGQKMIQEKPLHSNELNKIVADNAPISIFTIDVNGVFTSINPAMARQSGLGDNAEEILIGRFNWIDNPYTMKCGLSDYIRKALSGREIVRLWDFPFITYGGDRTFFMNFTGVPLSRADGKTYGLLCIIEDTTERVKAQALLAQEAKMAAVGRLAASIAHNLNNPLATITANSELALIAYRRYSDNDYCGEDLLWKDVAAYLGIVNKAAYRCTNIIADMLKLSRKDGLVLDKININKVLDGICDEIDFKKHKIQVTRNLSADLPEIMCDGRALQQVFLNLLNNAVDALESKPRGRISMRTEYHHGTVTVKIGDNGMGIPGEIMDKIFEPFFTTKTSKKDLGLGLALCYEFLREMGGKIKVKSKPAKGTTFLISLPVNADREGEHDSSSTG